MRRKREGRKEEERKGGGRREKKKRGRRSGEGTVRATSWLSESAFLYHAAPGKGREIIIHNVINICRLLTFLSICVEHMWSTSVNRTSVYST